MRSISLRWHTFFSVFGLLGALFILSGCSNSEPAKSSIPTEIGDWKVEVGPAGNEYYVDPSGKLSTPGQEFEIEKVPPSKEVKRWVEHVIPSTGITKTIYEYDGKYHRYDVYYGHEFYDLKISRDGDLITMEYKNPYEKIEEDPDRMVYKGTKKPVPVDQVPEAALKALKTVLPELEPQAAFTADTVAGKRYGIDMGELVFYVRPDGQIQAAGRKRDGALSEIQLPGQDTFNEVAYVAEMEEQLGPFRKRFNFERLIGELKSTPRTPDGSYRFIVMGDSRSQWDLWSNMVKHIDSLDPKPAFIINSGDIVPKGYVNEFVEYIIPPLKDIEIPFFVAIGNHDDGADSKAREFTYLFGENSLNYYFDFGGARYIFIDNVSASSDPSDVLSWLEESLGNTPDGMRKYVSCHRPPRNIEKWAYHAWDQENSEKFTALMTQHQVDDVFLGHIHAYSTAVHDGISYTIAGGGGAGLHSRFGPMGNVHHYVICDVSAGGKVTQQVVRFTEK